MTPTGTLTNLAPGKGGIKRDPWTLADHRFPGSQREMLRRCLAVSFRVRVQPNELRAQVEVLAERVGHRVPTGFVDRNVLLVVEAYDRDGQLVRPRSGSRLPELAGRSLAGKAGRLYAKQLLDGKVTEAIPFWRHQGTIRDTRLAPGRPDRSQFVFPNDAHRVRMRLLYRRFWHEVAAAKGWPDNETVVLERVWTRP
jgi:hypothetical protein